MRRTILSAVVLAGVAAAASTPGCRTQTPSLVHPGYRGRPFQECAVDLTRYESVQLRPAQDPALSVALAISGGGHRSTNFAAGVMMALEEIRNQRQPARNALGAVDYLSTTSGGGLAAGAYVASLHDHLAFGGKRDEYSFAAALAGAPETLPPLAEQRTDPRLREHLKRGYANDLVQGLFSAATLGTLNRGHFLENAFDDYVLCYLWRARKLAAKGKTDARPRRPGLTLGDMFIRAGSGRDVLLPQWVANATVYENGAMFAFTPDHLKLYRIRGYTHRMAVVNRNDETETYDEFLANVPLSLGMLASGNFPVAIPATTLKSGMDTANPYLHLLDGGLADNLGVITALRLLRAEPHRKVTRKVLIVIDATRRGYCPFSDHAGGPMAVVTAFRTTAAHVDSWRGRYREITRALCSSPAFAGAAGAVQPVFLTFDELIEARDCRPLLDFGLSRRQLDQVIARAGLTAATATPFDLLRSVLTWYDITPAEQNLLFAAGRWLVHRNRRAILAALGWPVPPP